MQKNLCLHVTKVVNNSYCISTCDDVINPKLYYSSSPYDQNPQFLQSFSGNQMWVKSPNPDKRIYFCLVSDNLPPQWGASTHVEIDTIANFRDMGGYKTKEGKTVKWGHFFRSGTLLPLNSQEKNVFESLNLKHVLDYRSIEERNEAPDSLPKGANYYPVPAMQAKSNIAKLAATDFATRMATIQTEEHGKKAIALFTELYIHLPFGNPAYEALFKAMDDPKDSPLIQHCSAGKDRTGVGCALVLLALGVDEETIMEDYLLSNIFRNSSSDVEMMKSFSSAQFSKEAVKVALFLSGVSRELLSTTFTEIKSRYSSYEEFFLKEYGISEEKLAYWQNRYTTI